MTDPRIDALRLWEALEQVSAFGGTDDGGLHRLCATAEDGKARDWLVTAGRELGLAVRVDRVGNVFMRRRGSGSVPALLMGSHLDSQPQAGRYDGTYGVVAALEVLRALHESGTATRHPVELVCWTDEEGARFAPAMLGSSVYAGVRSADEALTTADADGVTLGEALGAIGYLGGDDVSPHEHAAYVELHIEQGPILENEGLDLAVVTGVQGMRWLEVTLRGSRGHAGTTPMELRNDALVAAAEVVTAVSRVGLARPHLGRATVGVLTVTDAAPNVVPDHVRLVVELRHPSDVPTMGDEVAELTRAAATAHGCSVEIHELLDTAPVVFDEAVLDELRAVVTALEPHHGGARELVSGAGHDAVQAATRVPTGMLFIPCEGGVSHSTSERITPRWAAKGAQALLEAGLRLDSALA